MRFITSFVVPYERKMHVTTATLPAVLGSHILIWEKMCRDYYKVHIAWCLLFWDTFWNVNHFIQWIYLALFGAIEEECAEMPEARLLQLIGGQCCLIAFVYCGVWQRVIKTPHLIWCYKFPSHHVIQKFILLKNMFLHLTTLSLVV